jgi:hypothetical protein
MRKTLVRSLSRAFIAVLRSSLMRSFSDKSGPP